MLPLVLLVDISLLLMEVNDVNGIITENILTVDGIAPGSDRNVDLGAVRYVTQTLEDAQKVQARKNIGVDGQVYPCMASTLESLNSSDLVGIYNQGYRAVQATNNETVVTLALAADGALEWQGCNEDTENLLDNPDFAIAQAGYGGTHGAQVYAADRWKGSGTGATFAAGNGGGLSITCGTGAAGCSQVVAEPPAVGEYFSFVVVVGGVPLIASGTWSGTAQDATATSGTITATVTAGSVQISVASGSATVDYCMLLYGSYTDKTLPPWEEPDYSVEIIKCQYFYRRDWVSYQATVPNAGIPGFSYPRPMRVAPTINIYNEHGNAGYIGSWGQPKAFKVVSTPATQERLYYINTETVPQTVVSCVYLIESIADL